MKLIKFIIYGVLGGSAIVIVVLLVMFVIRENLKGVL
jgi:hypothetical protein